MEIKTKIKKIETIHTNEESDKDQPMIEFTFEITRLDMPRQPKSELRFTKTLSSIAETKDIDGCFKEIVKDYIEAISKGQEGLDEAKEWKNKKKFLNKSFIVDV